MTQATMDYPESPGYKTESPSTSKEAAAKEAGRAATLREQVWGRMSSMPLTTDECAEDLQMSVLAIRPRFSELRKMGKIEPTGERRKNASGHSACVWRIKVNHEQQELL